MSKAISIWVFLRRKCFVTGWPRCPDRGGVQQKKATCWFNQADVPERNGMEYNTFSRRHRETRCWIYIVYRAESCERDQNLSFEIELRINQGRLSCTTVILTRRVYI